MSLLAPEAAFLQIEHLALRGTYLRAPGVRALLTGPVVSERSNST